MLYFFLFIKFLIFLSNSFPYFKEVVSQDVKKLLKQRNNTFLNLSYKTRQLKQQKILNFGVFLKTIVIFQIKFF